VTLIRHPQIECEGPDYRVRFQIPTDILENYANSWPTMMPPGWHRHTLETEGERHEEDYHSEECLLDALIARNSHLLQVREMERQVPLSLDQAKVHSEGFIKRVLDPVVEQIGAEAARKMEERTRAAGIGPHVQWRSR